LTRENAFSLRQLPAAKFEELTGDSYTVIRSDGSVQDGFRIPTVGHYCGDKQLTGWQNAHAWDSLEDSKTIAAEQAEGEVQVKPFKKWKVHLVKFSEIPGYHCCDVCGWRTMMPDNGVGAYKNQRTFWPTRLTTPEEREAWWLEMDAVLNSLKRTADLSPDERAAINAPMQGTAADLIKLAMIAVEDWLEKEQLKTKLLLQVHDELVLDVPLDEIALLQAKLPGLMCNVAQLKVPLVVSIGIGDNWEEAH
jgi:hypothetical protein